MPKAQQHLAHSSGPLSVSAEGEFENEESQTHTRKDKGSHGYERAGFRGRFCFMLRRGGAG